LRVIYQRLLAPCQLFIVVEHLPLSEDVSGAIIEEQQQSLRETGQRLLNGGETRPDEKQGDVEDVGYGDWVIVEGSDV
jgi:hypothetical protein